MNSEQPTNADPRNAAAETGVTSTGIQYAKAPSMLWFIVPMALLLAYGALSR